MHRNELSGNIFFLAYWFTSIITIFNKPTLCQQGYWPDGTFSQV